MNTNEKREEKRQNILNAMEESFVMVPAKVMGDVAEDKITSSAFVLYCYLLFRQGKNPNYWGSIKDICWGTGISPAQVSRLLKQLELRGHIKRSKRVGATWLTYCLTHVNGRQIYFRGDWIGRNCAGRSVKSGARKEPATMVLEDKSAPNTPFKDESDPTMVLQDQSLNNPLEDFYIIKKEDEDRDEADPTLHLQYDLHFDLDAGTYSVRKYIDEGDVFSDREALYFVSTPGSVEPVTLGRNHCDLTGAEERTKLSAYIRRAGL